MSNVPRALRLVCTVALLSCPALVGVHDGAEWAEAAAVPGKGKITVLEGTAKRQAGGAGSWALCRVGTTVAAGDRLSTEPQARLEISFEDGSTLRMEGDTQIDLEATGTVARVKLWFGKLGASVKKLASPGSQFEVNTPTVTAAVRGTQFRVEVDGAEEEESAGTEVAVYEGEVEVLDLAGEIEAIEDDPQGFEARRDQYAVRVRANQRVTVARRHLLQRQYTGEVVRVGVLPFRESVQSVTKAAGMMVAERIAELLRAVAKGRYEVVPPRDMQSHLAGLSAASREVKHMGVLQEVARKAKVDMLVVGTVSETAAAGAQQPASPGGRRAFPALGGRRPLGGGKARGKGARAGGREQRGLLVVNIRAVHPKSGQVVFAKTLRFGASIDREALQRLLSAFGDRFESSVPPLGVVVSAQGNAVRLRMRDVSRAQPGQRYLLLKRNQSVVHPRTGKRLAPRVAGVVEIRSVAGNTVTSTVVSRKGGVQIAQGDLAAPMLSAQRQPLRPRPLDVQREAARTWLRGRRGRP